MVFCSVCGRVLISSSFELYVDFDFFIFLGGKRERGGLGGSFDLRTNGVKKALRVVER